jgi:hypothetical protein
MPKAPILYRESFYADIRGGPRDYLGNPAMRELEYYVVETEIGTMVEPRSLSPAFAQDANKVAQIDITDNSISKFSRTSEEVFQNQYGTGGASLADFNV